MLQCPQVSWVVFVDECGQCLHRGLILECYLRQAASARLNTSCSGLFFPAGAQEHLACREAGANDFIKPSEADRQLNGAE